jgi:hypothetical protein
MAALAPPVGELEDLQKRSNFKFERYRTTGNEPNYNVPQYSTPEKRDCRCTVMVS